MTAKLLALVRRIPWRLPGGLLGTALVVSGGSRLLSIELPADSEQVTHVAYQGMGLVLVGGVVLIAVVVSR